MERLSVDDEFLVLTDTDETPMLIGALQYYEVPGAELDKFYPAIRAHFEKRLPATPLLCIYRESPRNYDTSVWFDVASCDLDRHIVRVHPDTPMSRADVNAFIEKVSMEGVDIRFPPFKVYVLDHLEELGAALFIKIHHSLADGIGFQSIMGLLHDDGPQPVYDTHARGQDESPPWWPLWLWQSRQRFQAEAEAREDMIAEREAARQAYDDFKVEPLHKRAPTPKLKLTKPTSQRRNYESMSLPLDKFKQAAKKRWGTINDVFLAVTAEALRRHLTAIDDLPQLPIVAMAPRSYRDAEQHGEYGNRIQSLNPCLFTNIADPMERFRAIQGSMEIEVQRGRMLEPLRDPDDRPYGARERRTQFAERLSGGGSILAGNISLSNVPGPKDARYMAGFRQVANFPAPTIGSGHFLTVILRRYMDQLDFGFMADPEQFPDVKKFSEDFSEALDYLVSLPAAQ